MLNHRTCSRNTPLHVPTVVPLLSLTLEPHKGNPPPKFPEQPTSFFGACSLVCTAFINTFFLLILVVIYLDFYPEGSEEPTDNGNNGYPFLGPLDSFANFQMRFFPLQDVCYFLSLCQVNTPVSFTSFRALFKCDCIKGFSLNT